MTMLLAGSGLSLAGVMLLWRTWRFGWQRRGRLQPLAGIAAWAVLGASLAPWIAAGGADRGVALAVLLWMIGGFIVLGFIGWREARSPRRPRNGRSRQSNARPDSRPAGALLARRIWVFLLAGPVAAGTALLLSLDLYALSNAWAPANRLAAVLLSAPMAWAALSVLATYDAGLSRRSALMAGILAIGVLGLAFGPGGTA